MPTLLGLFTTNCCHFVKRFKRLWVPLTRYKIYSLTLKVFWRKCKKNRKFLMLYDFLHWMFNILQVPKFILETLVQPHLSRLLSIWEYSMPYSSECSCEISLHVQLLRMTGKPFFQAISKTLSGNFKNYSKLRYFLHVKTEMLYTLIAWHSFSISHWRSLLGAPVVRKRSIKLANKHDKRRLTVNICGFSSVPFPWVLIRQHCLEWDWIVIV